MHKVQYPSVKRSILASSPFKSYRRSVKMILCSKVFMGSNNIFRGEAVKATKDMKPTQSGHFFEEPKPPKPIMAAMSGSTSSGSCWAACSLWNHLIASEYELYWYSNPKGLSVIIFSSNFKVKRKNWQQVGIYVAWLHLLSSLSSFLCVAASVPPLAVVSLFSHPNL